MSSKGGVKTVELQLTEAGEKLLHPPASLDELIALLDLAETALGKVEQSPVKSMHDALSSLREALVSDELLGHPDTDVKVSVASCISEITRITAPDAPYDDEKMKRVFQLIVSSFENLSDKASRSYNKRAVILETVAKVRSCVIMLDLECDDLITEMFQIFFRTIRDYHPNSIFTSMETIMNLVLEESEEVSMELLTTLLSSLKRDDEEVLPIARQLGEKILLASAVKLKPYLTQAIKHSDISLNNYSNILTSVCEENFGEDASNALVQQKPSDGCNAVAESIEVTQEGDGFKTAVASSQPTQEGNISKAVTAALEEIQVNDGNKAAVASSEETQADDGSKAAAASSEETQEDAKDVERYSLGDKFPSAKRSAKTTGSNGTNMANKEKASVKGDLSQKRTGETENKSTNDEEIPKPGSHSLGVEKSTASESKSKSKKTSKNRRKKPSSSKKSVESSEPSHADSKKEENMLPNNVDCHEKDTDEDVTPKVKNVESEKVTGDIKGLKDVNSDSPTPSAGEADESLPKKDSHQQETECVSQGEVSSPERVTEKESERASDSLEAVDESPAKESPQESLKDESSVEVGTSKPEDSGSSDSEDKPVKKPAKKLDLSDSDDDLLLKKKPDSIKRARTKTNRPGKGASKSFTKDDVKEAVSSQNRSAKSAKLQENEVEVLSKRKRSLGKEASGQLKYGKNLIRSKIKVWWPIDQQFYEGVIVSYEPDKRKHQVVYDDGEVELLNLRKEKFQIVGDSITEDEAEPASTDASSEMPKSKKVKKSATSFVKQQDLDDISPKRLSASSSKSKGISSRSGKKAKNGKAETKSKDVTSKFGANSEDESGSKSKAHSQSGSKTKAHMQKSSGKSVNDAPRSSGKAKDIGSSIPKSKSKDETPKTSGRSKDDTLKTAVKGKALGGSGTKSSANANGAGKVKFSLSKGKGSQVQEKPSESSEVPESTKRKLSDSSKDQGGEAKSEKKRRRSVKG